MGDDDEEQTYTVQYIDANEAATTWISRAGRAEVTYANVDVYEGGYNEGKQRHGNGTYTWNSLTPEEGEPEEDEEPAPPPPLVKYTGQYQYGLKHGIGTMIYPDGSKYRGQWAYNKRHGQGTYEYKDGNKYSGEWKEDKRHGYGVFVFTKTKSQLVGTFVAGQMVKGKWLLADGTVYTGNFKNSTPEGNGSFTLPNGNTLSGKYVKPSEEEEDEEEEGGPKAIWVSSGNATLSVTTHAELARPDMPGLPYVPAWDAPAGNLGLRITELNEAGGWAVIKNVKAAPVENAEGDDDDDEDKPPKDTSANLRGMTLSIESSTGSRAIVFEDISLPENGKVRLLSGAAAGAPPQKAPPAEGEEEEEEEEETGTKEYFVSNDNMFQGGLASISLTFTDLQGLSQLVWKITKDDETGALKHDGKFKPIPPPEPETKEGSEEEEEEDD